MWRPSSTPRLSGNIGHMSRVAAVSAIGLAALAAWRSSEAFTSMPQHRPAGHFITVEKLPRGMVCRGAFDINKKIAATYNKKVQITPPETRTTWNPLPQWRGEQTWHPSTPFQADENRQWYHFDAEGKTLGHLAQAIAATLRGKHSTLYTPAADVGAFVVVTNCEKVRVTGKKYHYKLYFRNLSFRPGHLKVERFKDLQKRFPERIIMKAVWGSMPKTKSCRRIFKERLKLFAGPNHLYYHEDPIEYPMHLIKDCTVLGNIPMRLRFPNMVKALPKDKAKRKEKFDLQEEIKLRKYKMFLRAQLAREGKDSQEGLSVGELAHNAERARMQKIRDDNEGIPTPKKVVHMHLGLNLPKKPVINRTPQR